MQTISIAVSAILIAAGLITAPSLINNARDVNAKQDLANIAHAQEYQFSDKGAYSSNISAVLATNSVKVTLSSGSEVGLITGANCYASFAKSNSGSYFYRTSDSSATSKIPAIWPVSKPAGYPANCIWPGQVSVGPTVSNLYANPSFEGVNGTPTYGYFSAGVTLDSTWAHSGSKSMRATAKAVNLTAGLPQGIIMMYDDTDARIKSTDTITVSAWVMSPITRTMNVSGRIDNPYTAEHQDYHTVVIGPTPQRVSVTYTTPVTSGSYGIQIKANVGDISDGDYFMVDDVMMSVGSTLKPYSDGSTPGWSWDGEVNNSSSFGMAIG